MIVEEDLVVLMFVCLFCGNFLYVWLVSGFYWMVGSLYVCGESVSVVWWSVWCVGN